MKIINSIAARAKTLALSVALCGSLFYLSPVTAFAGGPDCCCETKCTEDNIDPDCPICQADYRNCEGKDPVIEEKWGPLTPDGNMELVDDYGSLEAGGKQFITVMTKNGNYFYIIIDRDDDGNEKVHFLNMVDESDLLNLMDEDQVSEYIAVTGKGKKDEPVEEKVEPVQTPQPEPVPEPVTEEEQAPKKTVPFNLILSLSLIIGIATVGGYIYYTTTKNSKKMPTAPDPDEGYTDQEYENSKDDSEDPEFEDDEEVDASTNFNDESKAVDSIAGNADNQGEED